MLKEKKISVIGEGFTHQVRKKGDHHMLSYIERYEKL